MCNIVHYDYKKVRYICSSLQLQRCAVLSAFFHPNQALDNVTESKVVMAEARQLLDFFMRKNFINEFGESSMHIMKVRFWSQLKSSFPGMSFPLWRGLCSSEGFTLHKEVPPNICHKHNFPRFSSKIQQLKESGLITLWIQQEQDLVAQRAEEGFDHQCLASIS